MAFNFEVKAIATLTGYVKADSEKRSNSTYQGYECGLHGCN